MPREHDFDGARRPGDWLFATFEAPRQGVGEIESARMPSPLAPGPHHQFVYDAREPLATYANETVDPVFAWLSAHVTSHWHWQEMECNHGHSVDIRVWIDNPEEAARFLEVWGDRFRPDEWAVRANARLRGEAAETPGFERATRPSFPAP